MTGAGTFAYLHMQIITFAYGTPAGAAPREPVSCLPRALSPLSLPVAEGWGGGRAGGVRPPVSLAQFPEELSKCCHGDGTHPTPSQAEGLELGVSGSLLSPHPRPSHPSHFNRDLASPPGGLARN